MTSAERMEKNLDRDYKQETAEWPGAVEWMKKARSIIVGNAEGKGKKGGLRRQKGKKGEGNAVEEALAEPKEVTYRREFWTLMLSGCYDWRMYPTKQLKRDYRRFAKVALVEQSAVKKYRGELFEYSAAARALRLAFRGTMKGLCTERTIKFEDDSPQLSHGMWVYADNIVDSQRNEDAVMVIDVDRLHRERGHIQLDTKLRLEYTREMKRMHKLGALSATPDTTDMHPEIATMMKQFDKVSAVL